MLSQKNLKKIEKFADEYKKIAAIYVFGSVATGRNRCGSDLDLAVMIHGKLDGSERIKLETYLSNLLGCDVDLSVFGQSDHLLQHQILKYGKLVYENDTSERVRQEVIARSSYLDTKFLFKEIRDNADDNELVSRKLSQLQNYVAELKQAEDITWEKYESDIRSKAFAERYIHLAIEKVIDIANHFISFHKWREPKGYRDIFLILHEHGIIPEKELESFQNMASFRNMLVHSYEKIDDKLVFAIFKKRLNDFDLFVKLIKEWLQTSG